MKKKAKAVVSRNAGELAEVLGLDRADGIEFAVRSALNTKIIEVIAKRRLTRAEVAALAGTSRMRVTMKTVSIRDLHARAGAIVREAARRPVLVTPSSPSRRATRPTSSATTAIASAASSR
jgi:hypothetical protein